jgi:hypothetical protein
VTGAACTSTADWSASTEATGATGSAGCASAAVTSAGVERPSGALAISGKVLVGAVWIGSAPASANLTGVAMPPDVLARVGKIFFALPLLPVSTGVGRPCPGATMN